MGVIYSILNKVNGKIYVGQTDRPLNRRISEHKYCLFKQTHVNPHLQNSWNKYGEDAFEFNALEYCPDEKLTENEDWWMDYFDSTNQDKGYNFKKGSSRGSFREETLHKMSLAHSGEKNAMFGRTHTPKSRKKMSYSKSQLMNKLGYYRVSIQKDKTCKQGFLYQYIYREDNKQKVIRSVDLDKLKEKVIAKGLEWRKLDGKTDYGY